MATIIARTVGIDISKHSLDACIFPSNLAKRFVNDAGGVRQLVAWLGENPVERIVFEPTGAYHHALERTLGSTGIPLVKVNPLQARRFVEAIGKRAKTDAIDAAVLARFGALAEIQSRQVVSQTIDDLRELLVARRALVKDRTAALNREQVFRAGLLKRLTTQRLRQIERQLEAVDAEMQAICKTDPDLRARLAVLISIPGIGEATAMILLIEMPELGSIEHKAVSSLAGLAPIARDSGQTLGRRFIRGGRANLRQALYMPSLVAIRFNAEMKARYQSLVTAGKPPKVAIVAVMRKLAILANALLKAGRNWEPRSI